MAPALADWTAWHARCALAPCPPATRDALRRFAWDRFRHYAVRSPGRPAPHDGELPSPEDCWHLLETSLATSRTRTGKRYKEWLFARLAGSPDPPLDVIQGGASLLMRSVVARHLRSEGRSPSTVSLDAPTGSNGEGLPLRDLLPDDAAADAAADVGRRLDGAAVVAPFLRDLAERERLLVLAGRLGLSLAHPAVRAATGLGRSRAYVLWQHIYTRLAEAVRQRFPDEPPRTQLALASEAAAALGAELFSWGAAEKAAAPLFREVEALP